MQKTDFVRFRSVLAGLAEVHQRELTPTILDAYWIALHDWALKDFEQAAGHLLARLTWMPKPSDFTELRNAGEPTAAEAWSHVVTGKQIAPESLLARVTRAIGGQQYIRHANIERDLPFIEKRFKEAYEEMRDADRVRVALPQIASEMSMRVAGLLPVAANIPKPLLEHKPETAQ